MSEPGAVATGFLTSERKFNAEDAKLAEIFFNYGFFQ
jgi:hypothetical protein